MTNSPFQLIVREGITGGFVGPTVKQVVEIRGDGGSGATILYADLKPDSKNDYFTQTGAVSTEQIATLFSTVKEKLEQLPTEEPVGSQDIYGLDTSIMFYTNDFQWRNGGPEGCTSGESSRQPTPEQKQIFAALVDQIRSFGKQYAVNTV